MANLTALTILSARIEPPRGFGDKAKVFVKMLENGPEELLFDYYSDELHFSPEEFIGLTTDQAGALFTKKDVAYLRS